MFTNIKNKLNKKTAILLVLIILAAIFFRVWNMNNFDISGDNSLNSFRALGWVDFIQGEGQTGPMQWFGKTPAWAKWSFQDAPPLVFAIQHVSFSLFGDNTFAARIPFVVAGVLTVLVIFLMLLEYVGVAAALLGAAFMAVSSYAVWASLTGFLEGILILFIALSLYFVLPWVEMAPENGSRRFRKYLWPVFAGLSLLSKYTSLFLLPAAAFSFLLFWKKKIFSKKSLVHIAISAVIIFILLLPVIVYNFEAYRTRGHFDSSLSAMVGMSSPDFSILRGRHATLNIVGNLTALGRTLIFSGSLPYFVLSALAFLWLAIKTVRKKNSRFENVLFIHTFFLILMLAFSSTNAVRILSIFTVFMALMSAVFVADTLKFLNSKRKIYGSVFFGIIIFIFAAESFYSVNTNILKKPIGQIQTFGQTSFLYSTARIYDRGWNAMERFVKENIFTGKREIFDIETPADIDSLTKEDIKGNNIMLFDERLNWFALSWHINKYLIYYKFPLFKGSVLGEKFPSGDPKGVGFFPYTASLGAEHAFFLYGMNDAVLDPLKQKGPVAESTKKFAESLSAAGMPYKEIKNGLGQVMFKIYKIR